MALVMRFKMDISYNKAVILMILYVALFALFPTLAFADGGQSNAVDTILRSSSLEGNDTYRNTISGYLNKPIALIISIAGFLMITLSFLRVVVTFLYLTFPDLFNKIDEHQRQAMQGGFKDRTPIDMISYVFAIILPNVKALSDYSKDDVEMDQTPIDYLKKKMPTILLFIILGAMIFDGQMRSFIAKAADIGMLFGNVFESHDTVGMVQTFIDTGERYTFTYDDSKQEGKNEAKIAKSIQKHLHGINANLKSTEHADSVGHFTEDTVEKVKAEMMVAAQKAGITKFEDIVNFNVSIQGRETPLRNIQEGVGSGSMQVEITDAAVLDQSKMKYMVIYYSQIVDKDNRNILFKATESRTPDNNGTQTQSGTNP